MTEAEYEKRLLMYQTSDASEDVKTAAIKKLNEKFYGREGEARELFYASQPDPIGEVD